MSTNTASNTDLSERDALELSAGLEAGSISAVELMQATLDRIDKVNGQVNAIVALKEADALLDEARVADASARKGWLHGIPMAIKDLSNAAGFKTTKGSPLFAEQVADKDDIFVARLKAAGAIIIGKTNTPEFGLGSHTFNPVYGATHNPYDLERSAGGSSGGAAAALATRMVSVADGSDMMGSLRNPAGWNNVYGMRPTWGTVPPEPEGEMFLGQLATAGPMARAPRDLAALLDTMTGADPRLPNSTSPPDTLPGIEQTPTGLHLGWLGDWGGAFPLEDGIAEISEAGVTSLGALGHVISRLKPPFSADAMWQSWIDLRSWDCACGPPGVHYADPAKRAKLKPAMIWEIESGLALSAMDIHRASLIRSDWFRVAAELFVDHDVLILPSAQMWPFDVSLVHPEEIAGTQMDTYHRWMQVVIPASLLGLPVVNIPVGFGKNGLPAGLQLIGPRGSDAKLLQLAQQWHVATNWPSRKPPDL